VRQAPPLKRPARLSHRMKSPLDKSDEGSWETF